MLLKEMLCNNQMLFQMTFLHLLLRLHQQSDLHLKLHLQ
jgi:hypothetical protein